MKTSRVFQAFCGLILLLLISGANTRAFASPTYALSVSTSASRGNGAALQGAALSGSVYIFTSNATSLQNYNPTGINKVCYWLDNTAMSGTATHCESVSPYDFVGTAADGSAEPWDTSKISPGSHSLTQAITRSNGGKEVDSATFTVNSTALPPLPPAGSTVVFRNLNSNLCVDTGGSSTFTALVQSACSSNSSQQFKLNSSPTTGWYYLAGATPNLCWDIAGGSLSAGAIIQQYTCTAVSPEYFQLKAVAGGYQILPKNLSNGCVDIVGASTSSGAQIEQNTCNGSANQNFQVSVISGSAPVAPSISTQPASQTVAAGQSATFSVAATGTAPMTYQWQKNGAAISGATSSTYATPATISSDNGTKFAALVSNSAGSVTSTAATLTVNTAAPPSVSISSPSNGATVSGSITVSGTASDGVGLSSVQVQVDSGVFSSASGTSNWSFSLNTSSLSNSSHTITARATDTSGISASSSVSVSVSNGTGGPSINVKNYGATGNGSTDDTAAINSAIAALSSGATLLFPCGT
ncbi:MAG TPA: RICIN domain-containing protein, partial [Terriglobales bacterium]|nr:RICIN domain-containing protein [Terriglobales bacterium]